MKNILFLKCSPHGDASLGTHLAQDIIGQMLGGHPNANVVSRDLGASPLPALTGEYAMAVTNAKHYSESHALSVSEELITELERCDFLLISTPMHNFSVPVSLKTWLDYVLRIGRTFKRTPEGKVGLLQDRPTLVLVRSGSPCSGDLARQPDFLTPYLRHTLACLGIATFDFHYLPGLMPSSDEVIAFRQSIVASPVLSNFTAIPT
ncbi:FMN-dependent NADH-azoreductase [Burkholderia sp. BCC1977]|uniref:FMN-dependent NADH-azoreductase n=1 Tax=Burkholderia sp. BCC1977 TaxID=2817440 RepID=UPI002ABE5EC0|nr:NAD(P)H-dependent oxidoreductase [Burkholderia sp. BCC1977]